MDLELGFVLDHFFQGYIQPWNSTNQQKPFLKWRGNKYNILFLQLRFWGGSHNICCTCAVLLRSCLHFSIVFGSYRWNSAPWVAAYVNNSHDAITPWTSGEVSACDCELSAAANFLAWRGMKERKLRKEGRTTKVRDNIQEKRPWRLVIPATVFFCLFVCLD